ncbi:precorrin-8x methylmutase [Leptolyngbya sp. Heron Island J]|uniref:precorrin-8X methylmutase n=1 Tax=Leptolyngbya sp. Heron Island J TaxID=1385935 RepID=UPI0003B9A146|nr:precorrin-8X methylmutase [Leptolyngbya sp. Heron Island J]ESA38692.1 precorrin-8x methylmutase [Leptolyngbya sp. Heron Island J]
MHPITAESFAIIDQEIGPHNWPPEEYAIIRRAIHATADFELLDLFEFSGGAVTAGIAALKQQKPVIVDVRMVQMGITGVLKGIGYSSIACALDYVPEDFVPSDDTAVTTRTAAGMLALTQQYSTGIFVVGNAPTALLALVEQIHEGLIKPSLVIGVPVGFVAVEEAKRALAEVNVPQVQVQGRKGGSPVAAAIVNALAYLSQE